MENSVRETINRLFVYLTGKSIKHLDFDSAMKLLNNLIRTKYGINLVIKYRRPKSVSTMDFNSMIDEIESENNEVILAVLDYTKRIKSSSPNSELRIELATIADDLCSIAKARNIPIVSASQLNRVAYQAVENAVARGKKDIIKDLNTSHIGESVGLIENPDVVFFINKEYDELTDEKFLSIKMVASRIETEEERGGYTFVQKYENGMKLEEDCDLSYSLSKKSISSNLVDNFDPNKFRNKRNGNEDNEKPDKNSRGLKGRKPEKPSAIKNLIEDRSSSPFNNIRGTVFEEVDDDEEFLDNDDTGLYEDEEYLDSSESLLINEDDDEDDIEESILDKMSNNDEVEVEEFSI
jgi:hypothetical protein